VFDQIIRFEVGSPLLVHHFAQSLCGHITKNTTQIRRRLLIDDLESSVNFISIKAFAIEHLTEFVCQYRNLIILLPGSFFLIEILKLISLILAH